jgi:hypothetical protein
MLKLREAIELLDAVSNFPFKTQEEKPDFCIFDNEKEGHSLSVTASQISEEYRAHIRKVAEPRHLDIRESDDIITIKGY